MTVKVKKLKKNTPSSNTQCPQKMVTKSKLYYNLYYYKYYT